MDNIKEPKHYTGFNIEPINFIMLNNFSGWVANVIKYACRAGRKKYDGLDLQQSEIEDCKKIIRYAQMRINMLEGRDPTQDADKENNNNGSTGNNGGCQCRLRNNKKDA